jgi:hypothetical protein
MDALYQYALLTDMAGEATKLYDEAAKVDIEELDKAITELIPLALSLKDTPMLQFPLNRAMRRQAAKSNDDVLTDFIKMMGW